MLLHADPFFEILATEHGDAVDEVWIIFRPYKSDQATEFGFFSKKNCAAIQITAKLNCWYQSPTIGLAIAAARRHASAYGKRIIVFGVSMGGFAALAYGQDLGADLILVGSPQVIMDVDGARPHDVRWDDDWARLKAGGLTRPDALPHLPPTAPIIVVYDPVSAEDRWHATQLRARDNVTAIEIPYGGHAIFFSLKEMKLWSAFLDAASAVDIDGMLAVTRQYRRRRRERPDYNMTMGHALMARHRPRMAERFFSAAIRQNRALPGPYFWLSMALQLQDRAPEAVKAAQRGVVAAGKDETYSNLYQRLAQAHTAANDLPRAIATYRRGINRFPNNARLPGLMSELIEFEKTFTPPPPPPPPRRTWRQRIRARVASLWS